MKITLVRSFVLVLALTAFGASTYTSNASTASNATLKQPKTNIGLPLCGPNDPNHCGLTDATN